MIMAATTYSSSHSATQVWLMLTVTSHMSLYRIKWKLDGCFRHVQSHIGRCRLAVQTGQQLSTAVLCTTEHVVRCLCDSNGTKLHDSRHQGHYNIVRKLASWSGESTTNIFGIPVFLKLLATQRASAVKIFNMQCLCSHFANMSSILLIRLLSILFMCHQLRQKITMIAKWHQKTAPCIIVIKLMQICFKVCQLQTRKNRNIT